MTAAAKFVLRRLLANLSEIAESEEVEVWQTAQDGMLITAVSCPALFFAPDGRRDGRAPGAALVERGTGKCSESSVVQPDSNPSRRGRDHFCHAGALSGWDGAVANVGIGGECVYPAADPMMSLPFKSALVTGGAGFIGHHITHALVAQGVKTRVIDDLSRRNRGAAERHRFADRIRRGVDPG